MFVKVFNIFMSNPWDYVLLAFIMVSALIVFLGLIKPVVFDKIPNKYVRKSALALASVALSFASVAVAFWVRGFNYDYYWIVGGGFSCITIITYWFYENTNLRTGIHKIGTFVLKKLTGLNVTNIKELKKELKKISPMVEEEAKVTLVDTAAKAVAKVDKELTKL